jgi:ribonuclease P protein component
MLPKENRLRKKNDFENVLRRGGGLKQDFLVLKLKENKLKDTRFGFIVSQKVSKKAVIRNRVKRRLREIIKLKMEEIKKGIDVVLIALPGAEKKDFSETKKEMEDLLKKSGALN